MRPLTPLGYISLRDAMNATAVILNAGLALSEAVENARDAGFMSRFTAEERKFAAKIFWEKIDATHADASTISARINIYVEQASTGVIAAIQPDQLVGVPFARSYRGADLSYLRSSTQGFQFFAERFKPPFRDLHLLVKIEDFEQLVLKLRRTRQRRAAQPNTRRRLGRPSRTPEAKQAIEKIVSAGNWRFPQPLKKLANLVNREIDRRVSDSVVGRALEELFQETSDPRYERPRKKQKQTRPR